MGAGSVVTRDVPEGVFAAGNPCRVIREIKESHRPFAGRRTKATISGEQVTVFLRIRHPAHASTAGER